MSGHEFEKQVRQKLNDLKMTPSAEAWENIEQNLREKKRRLAPVLWLPLLLLGLTAGGFLFYRSSIEGSSVEESAPQVTASQPSIKKENSPSGSLNDVASAPQVTASQPSIKKENSPSGGSLDDVASAPQAKAFQPSIKKENKPSGNFLKDLASAPQKTPKNNDITAFNKIPSLYLTNEKSEIIEPTLHYPTVITAYQLSGKIIDPIVKNSSKWSWGLNGVAGVSSVSEGNFFNLNFNKAQVEDVATVAMFAPQPPFTPSSISSGFTYSAGAFVKRDLSKKFSLSAGLNYLQLNTRNKVGSRINQRQVVNNGTRGYIFVSSYYTLQQDQPSEYRNRYHFVEVPVELHTRVNKSQKVQMFVNTGLAVSRLIKSNSLHFDGTTGVYYKNDKLLNRTQLATRVGLSFGLLNNTSRPIWIGPYARYNISRILQKDVSASKSFASFGLDMKLFIK
ncbi:MAG: outer membrane beta-barrel protein [Chitinophagaceae bacterium]|nr:outer membrane beta-barrel protein [Chitinophagaceae bacterium]